MSVTERGGVSISFIVAAEKALRKIHGPKLLDMSLGSCFIEALAAAESRYRMLANVPRTAKNSQEAKP